MGARRERSAHESPRERWIAPSPSRNRQARPVPPKSRRAPLRAVPANHNRDVTAAPSLKIHLQLHLDNVRRVAARRVEVLGIGGNFPEGATCRGGDRVAQIGVIQDVEEVGAEVELPRLARREPRGRGIGAFTTLEGRALDTSAFSGKVVVVNFWATWCVPCIEEIPGFNKLNQQLGGQGVVVLGVSMDEEGAERVRPPQEAPHGRPGRAGLGSGFQTVRS